LNPLEVRDLETAMTELIQKVMYASRNVLLICHIFCSKVIIYIS
jgi:hypothetical protein